MTPYFQDACCTIYHGDCRDFLPGINADLILTDPPYGVGFRYDGFTDDQESWVNVKATLEGFVKNFPCAIFMSFRRFFEMPPPPLAIVLAQTWFSKEKQNRRVVNVGANLTLRKGVAIFPRLHRLAGLPKSYPGS